MPICMIIMKVDIYIPHKTGYLLCHETGSPKKKFGKSYNCEYGTLLIYNIKTE